LSEIATATLSVALTWTSALRARDGNTQLTALYIAGAAPGAASEGQLQKEIERARADAGTAAHVRVRGEIEEARDPVEGVLRSSKKMHADLVILGTHGVADTDTELGSVTAAVVRANPCPLLLVPPSLGQAPLDFEAR
jgi:nucleotide-binding universal stress UspA family protein